MDPRSWFDRQWGYYLDGQPFDVWLDRKVVAAWVLAALRYDSEAVDAELSRRIPQLANDPALRKLVLGLMVFGSQFFYDDAPAWPESLEALIELKPPEGTTWSFDHPWMPRP